MSKVVIILIVVVLLAGGAYYFLMGNKTQDTPDQVNTETKTVETTYKNVTERTIALGEQNDSGESGSAVLTEKDGKVTVSLDMTGAPAGVPQPAHIHVGSCPDVGAVAYPLTNVVDGKSVTVLDTTFALLDAKEPLAINVHKSVPETKVYVSCGNLGALNTSPSATPTSSATPSQTSSPAPSPTASPASSPTPSPSPAASAG